MNKFKFNKLNILLSLFTSILISLVHLPVVMSGGFRGYRYYSFTNIINYIKKTDVECTKCIFYGVDYFRLIVQIIIVISITYLLLTLIDKRRKKNG